MSLPVSAGSHNTREMQHRVGGTHQSANVVKLAATLDTQKVRGCATNVEQVLVLLIPNSSSGVRCTDCSSRPFPPTPPCTTQNPHLWCNQMSICV